LTDLAQQRRQRLIGIALMVGAVATFSCLDSTAKYLNHYMDTLQVVWARYTGAFILALLVSNPINRPGLMLTRRPWLQIGRSALLFGSTVLNFVALRWLQLDEALSILFATPFLVAVLSGPILGEWIGWRRWIAILVGFSGVLLVTRPGFGGIHPAALLSVLSAICYALYTISTRILARTDSNQTTLFYTNLVGAAVMIPIVPFVWTTPHDPLIIGLMTVAGAFASVGHYMLIAAHRRAPASTLAPFIYAQLISVLILGYFVFGNLPTAWTLAGAAIVVGSGLYILNRERKVGVQTTQTTLPPEV
jgi:drug/metabolite transporter (DMT)-like permease